MAANETGPGRGAGTGHAANPAKGLHASLSVIDRSDSSRDPVVLADALPEVIDLLVRWSA